MPRNKNPIPPLPPELAEHERIDRRALAALLCRSVESLEVQICKNPRRFPQGQRIAGRILYRKSEVLSWLDTQRDTPERK
jgi:hypothetical protein